MAVGWQWQQQHGVRCGGSNSSLAATAWGQGGWLPHPLPHCCRGGDKDTGGNSNGRGTDNNQQSSTSCGGNNNGNSGNDSNDNDNENDGKGKGEGSDSLAVLRRAAWRAAQGKRSGSGGSGGSGGSVAAAAAMAWRQQRWWQLGGSMRSAVVAVQWEGRQQCGGGRGGSGRGRGDATIMG